MTNPRSRAFREERQDLFTQGLRRCYTCLEILSIDQFTTATNGANGINGQCLRCHREGHRDRYSGLYESLRDGERRARAAGAPAEHLTPAQVLDHWEKIGIDPWECAATGERLTQETRNIDHVDPLSRPGSLGHSLVNIVPVVAGYNRHKKSLSVPEAVAGWWEQPGRTPKDAAGIEGRFTTAWSDTPERGAPVEIELEPYDYPDEETEQ